MWLISSHRVSISQYNSTAYAMLNVPSKIYVVFLVYSGGGGASISVKLRLFKVERVGCERFGVYLTTLCYILCKRFFPRFNLRLRG